MEVCMWCNKFKDGGTGLNDDPQKHRGRPRTSHTDENCVIVKGLIREDRRVEVCEIAEVTGIAKRTVCEIISDLNFHQVSALSTTSHFSPDSGLVEKSESWKFCSIHHIVLI
jgi:hypothetical protein